VSEDWHLKPSDELVERVVYDESEIKERVRSLGKEISEAYGDEEILVVGILRGAFVFMADLIRELDLPLTVDFMLVSSYEESRTSSGVVRIVKDTKKNIQDCHVLIVEDIIDTGYTYNSLRKTLSTRDPSSLKICALLNKESNREVDVDVDFYGFDAPDEFLVGYGLDYREYHRECPYIFVPTEKALEKLDE
jgi:hypoxanthine phosphoribosyltransferase